MMNAHTRPVSHPAVLSHGFRPFFLLGSLYAAMAIVFWLPLLNGSLQTMSLLAPVDWHIHEMLFGYLPAVVTGFLLTAIPNWTGRLPIRGRPLLALALLWLAGRLAIFFSAKIGWGAAAAIDCAFLMAVASAAAKQIIAGRNWRNLKVLAPVAVMFAANVLFHIETRFDGVSSVSRRLGMGAAVVLIMVIGGRIIPSFSRNWLVRENPGRVPAPFGLFDAIAILLSVGALAAWTFLPERVEVGAALILAAGLNFARLFRWAGDRTLRDPLVLILHVAYLFVPVGLALAGLSAAFPNTIPPAAGIHAFGTGAIGTMTLAVMTRATLGHTGRELRAGAGACLIFAAIVLSAALRIAAPFAGAMLVHFSAALWTSAFLGYAALFGGKLMRPRLHTAL
jgi:uncharacterized protein involved in response to NO